MPQPEPQQPVDRKANGAASTPSIALANTMPTATSSTTGALLGTRIATGVPQDQPLYQADQILQFKYRSLAVPEAFRLGTTATKAVPQKPAGHIKLFQIVMNEWNFSDAEAATLLGFENVTDVRDVLSGRRAVGQRDANDRLRAVLRIAADLTALYQDNEITRAWLDQPQPKLGGVSPKQLLVEGSMENLLLVKYYVSQLSGR